MKMDETLEERLKSDNLTRYELNRLGLSLVKQPFADMYWNHQTLGSYAFKMVSLGAEESLDTFSFYHYFAKSQKHSKK